MKGKGEQLSPQLEIVKILETTGILALQITFWIGNVSRDLSSARRLIPMRTLLMVTQDWSGVVVVILV